MKHLGVERLALVFFSCVAIGVTSALLCACLGSGDDGGYAPPQVTDAGDAGDAHDAPADGILLDAPPDAVQDAVHEEAAQGTGGDATLQDGGGIGADSGVPVAALSTYLIDFGPVGCGASSNQTLTVKNTGGGKLAISATTTGLAFAVSPANLMLAHGATGTLNLTAKIPTTASPGALMAGALNLFTNDPNNPNVSIHLSATPSGAVLSVFPATVTFPVTRIGTPAGNQLFFILNNGNAPITFSVGAPSDSQFTLTPPPSGPVTLNGGQIWSVATGFTPNGAGATAKSTLTAGPGAVVCGNGAAEVDFSGNGTQASVTGWPTLANGNEGVDFPDAGCGGPAPAPYTFVLQNVGTVPATVTGVSIDPAGAGFTTNVSPPAAIPGDGGTLNVTVTPPPFPSQSGDGGTPAGTMPAAVTAQLNMTVDSTNAHSLSLSEEPYGASLNFQTIQGFGNFSDPVVLLAPPTPNQTQTFGVANTGNAPANVNLVVTDANGSDAGADAQADAATVAGVPMPFSVDVANPLAVPPTASGTPGVQDSITFSPVVAGGNVAQLAMSVDSSTVLCAQLPSPITLTGTGIGGGPSISPTTLSFYAPCDGTSMPSSQVLTVSNNGTRDLNWSMSALTGPGVAQYTLGAPTVPSTNPQPGLLRPGESSTIAISAGSIVSSAKSGTAAPAPATLAAQLTITTDVPYDNPHAVTLNEIPQGDQLSVSVGSLSFGQFPINQSTQALTFTLTNNGNAGPNAPSASVALTSSNSAYSVSPSPVSLAPGGGAAGTSTESVVFTPPNGGSIPAQITITQGDPTAPLCAPLPAPIQLNGSGTQGLPAVSPSSFDFGLVNCGMSGQAETFTVTNQGNQPFNVTGVQLGKGSGASSPFTLSALPTGPVVGNASVTFTVTPNPIPTTGVDPMDKSAYSDVLTVTTDAANDTPHTVPLTMQPQGSAIVIPTPVLATWNFGTVGYGSVGTMTSVFVNNGNAPATVALTQVSQPAIFNLANSPTTIADNGETSLVGQFAPPSANGSWTDQGVLVLTASQAFCSAPPAGWQPGTSSTIWTGPTIALSGSSNSSPPVTASGTFAFPATDCGSGPPAAQTVTLTNTTNQSYPFTVKLNVGRHYTVTVGADGGTSATLPANGIASLVVAPLSVTPGQGVLAGSAPYADDVFVSVGNPAVWSATFPVSWTLNGAVLSLPLGAGDHSKNGSTFYVADSNSGHTLPIDNQGTAAASVNFALTPAGGLSISPTPPIGVVPGIRALPVLNSTSAAATCPSQTQSSPTFSYSGAVCQPLPFASVSVYSCMGTVP